MIYVASRVKHAPIWRNLRDEKKYPIISSWIDEAGEGETEDFTELWNRISEEIETSSVLVFYSGPNDAPFKGALVEVGMALAFKIPVWVILENVSLEERSLRPIGSWLEHPKVTVTQTTLSLEETFTQLLLRKSSNSI